MIPRALIIRLALIICVLSSGLGVIAQDRESQRPAVKFALSGGRSNNYLYYLADHPGNYVRIIDILQTALPIYDTLRGGIPWFQQITVVMMDTVPAAGEVALGRNIRSSDGYVIRLEPPILFDSNVCHLRIYANWETAPDLESSVARELFHCVQAEFSNTVTLATYLDPAQTWWTNGSAEWAAAQVFPSQYPSSRQNSFDHRHDVTTTDYAAFYFWQFAPTPQGMGSVDAVRSELSLIASDALSATRSMGNPTTSTELFHNWILALYNRTLPVAPTLDLTTSDTLAGQAGSANVSIPRFSGDFVNLVGFDVQPGNVAFVRATGIATANFAVSLETASGIQRLSADTAFEFCPSTVGNMVIISRGYGAPGSTSTFTLEWGQTLSHTPCTPAATRTPASTSTACYVGDWEVVGVPGVIGSADTSGYVFSFADDGTFTGTYAIVIEDFNATYPMTGTYRITGSRTDATRYTARSFHIDYGPGTATGMINGELTDMSAVVLETLNSSGNLEVPFDIVCTERQMVWTVADGHEFTLARISP